MGSAAAGPCLDLDPAGGRRLSRQASWTAISAPRPQPLSLRHPPLRCKRTPRSPQTPDQPAAHSVVGFRFVVTPRVAWVTGIHGPTRRHVGRIRVPLTVEHHGCRTRTAWPVAPMRTAALIAPDAERGQWAWERALRHPPAGFVRLPDPALGSTYHLYQRTGQDMIDVQVVCRESNAVVGVTLSGTSDVARADTAVHAASVMIQRVQTEEIKTTRDAAFGYPLTGFAARSHPSRARSSLRAVARLLPRQVLEVST